MRSAYFASMPMPLSRTEKSQTVGLSIADCGLRIAESGLADWGIADCGLRIADWSFAPAGFVSRFSGRDTRYASRDTFCASHCARYSSRDTSFASTRILGGWV